MTTPASPPPLPPWRPSCPVCRYDLTGTPEGRCPECGAAFTIAMLEAAERDAEISLLSERQKEAVVRITGRSVVLAVPIWLTLSGARITIISGIELLRGCHWTDTNYNSRWTPQSTRFPIAQEAFAAGLLWLLTGIGLCLLAAPLLRLAGWLIARPSDRYIDARPEKPESGVSRQ